MRTHIHHRSTVISWYKNHNKSAQFFVVLSSSFFVVVVVAGADWVCDRGSPNKIAFLHLCVTVGKQTCNDISQHKNVWETKRRWMARQRNFQVKLDDDDADVEQNEFPVLGTYTSVWPEKFPLKSNITCVRLIFLLPAFGSHSINVLPLAYRFHHSHEYSGSENMGSVWATSVSVGIYISRFCINVFVFLLLW